MARKWATSEVEVTGFVTISVTTGIRIAVARTSGHQPHILYYDWTNERLRHAWRVAGVWQTETVDATTGAGREVSAVFDADDVLHIAYVVTSTDKVMYRKLTSGSWSAATEIAGAEYDDNYVAPSIAIDPATGRPSIALYIYYGAGHTDVTNLYIYEWSGSAWVSSQVFSSYFCGYRPQLAYNGSNEPVISHEHFWSYPYVDTRSGGSWSQVQLTSDGYIYNEETDLIFDANGVGYLATEGERSVKLWMKPVGEAWQHVGDIDTTETGGNAARPPTIAAGPNGIVGVAWSYYSTVWDGADPNYSSVRYVEWNGASWTAEEAHRIEGAGNIKADSAILVYDEYDRPAIAWRRYSDGALMFTECVDAPPGSPIQLAALGVHGHEMRGQLGV